MPSCDPWQEKKTKRRVPSLVQKKDALAWRILRNRRTKKGLPDAGTEGKRDLDAWMSRSFCSGKTIWRTNTQQSDTEREYIQDREASPFPVPCFNEITAHPAKALLPVGEFLFCKTIIAIL